MSLDHDFATELARQPAVAIGFTAAAFLAAQRLQKLFGGQPLLNPTLVAILIIVVALGLLGIPYDSYRSGASFIHFLLGPAVVLLAVPMFRQSGLMQASGGTISVALVVGIPAGVASGTIIAWALGAKPQTLLSLVPKSVTAGISMPISEQIGGIASLTAVLTIMTGIAGAMLGPMVLKLARVRDPRIVGLALGVTSHGIGTARAMQVSETAGAFAGLAMALGGVMAAVVIPFVAMML